MNINIVYPFFNYSYHIMLPVLDKIAFCTFWSFILLKKNFNKATKETIFGVLNLLIFWQQHIFFLCKTSKH